MLRFLKIVFRISLYGIGLVFAWALLSPLLWAPVYDFPDPQAFQGSEYYNPYKDLDSTQWKKGNFQIQTRLLWGMTNGRGNTSEMVEEAYRALNYDIICISDYMYINRDLEDSKEYVSVYEHGISVGKQHQVCIGTEDVFWLDYPLWQNRDCKQFVLQKLASRSKSVALAHPSFAIGYSLEDMQYLGGYQLVEAITLIRKSFEHWDAALSAGKPVFVLGDDDAHNLANEYEYGLRATIVNTQEVNDDAVCESLNYGRSYGYIPNIWLYGDLKSDKQSGHGKTPYLKSVEMRGDTMIIDVDTPVWEIKYIGQNGEVKKNVIANGENNSYLLKYVFQPEDTYIRAEIMVEGYDMLYTNPVFRTSNGELPSNPIPEINWVKTLIFRGGAWLLLGLVVLRIYKRKRSRSIAS
jgi:hypothetical protein